MIDIDAWFFLICHDDQPKRALGAFKDALALVWAEGRDDGLDDFGATQTAIDFGELANPYEENK